jgi:hypothetical protein
VGVGRLFSLDKSIGARVMVTLAPNGRNPAILLGFAINAMPVECIEQINDKNVQL